MKFVNNIDFKYYEKKILDKVTWKKSLFIWSFILSVDIKLVLKDIYVNVD